ncbi:MAG: LicD family protein [Fibrobacter sp.]|nr:LicD family protein [Fibrobacter sp.]
MKALIKKVLPKPVKAAIKAVYKKVFKNKLEVNRLNGEVEALKYQIDYFKHHFDIKDMKPATGYLRDYQLKELEFTQKILKMLESYDIFPFLEGGALLGALRHGGFIPWDDDIDVGVTRKDFNKLMEIAKKDFVWVDSTKNTGNYAKFYDDSIRANPDKLVFIRSQFCLHLYQGTCLRDALNLEFFSNDFVKENVTEEQYVAYRQKVHDFIHGDHSWDEVLAFYDKELENSEIYSLEPTSRITPGLGNWVLTEYKFHGFRNYDELYPLKPIPFEGTTLPGPNKADIMLDKQFGKNWGNYPKDIGIPHSLLDLNEYLETIGTPIDFKEF